MTADNCITLVCAHCGIAFLRRKDKVRPQHNSFCTTPCHRAYKSDRSARFWEKVIPDLPEKCWLWTGATANGYGTFRFPSDGSMRMLGAHVVAYILTNGSIPMGKEVCHVCDNTLCVNPAHLWTGTHQENIDDAIAKGRVASGDRHYARKNPGHGQGSKNTQAKVTEADVQVIRHLAKQGIYHRVIAAQYHISRPAVSLMVSGDTWGHVL